MAGPSAAPRTAAPEGNPDVDLIPDLTAPGRPATWEAADAPSRGNRRRAVLGGGAPRRAARPPRRARFAPRSRSRAARRGRDRGGLSAAWRSDDRAGGVRAAAKLRARRVLLVEVASQPTHVHAPRAQLRAPVPRPHVVCLPDCANGRGRYPGGRLAGGASRPARRAGRAFREGGLAPDPQLQRRHRGVDRRSVRDRRPLRRRELLSCQRDPVRVASRRRIAHLAAPQRRHGSPAHRPAVLVQPDRIPQRVDDRAGGARVPRGRLRRGRIAVQYPFRRRRPDRRGCRAGDQPGLRGKHRARAVAVRRPDARGQHPHRARQGALPGATRSARRDGRRGAPGRLLADDRGDRQMTATAPTAPEPAVTKPNTARAPTLAGPSRVASDEVHVWSACLDVPAETLARLYATLAVDERNRSARFRFQRDRRHFIVAHGVLREVLGRYLQTEAGRIGFVYLAYGKPYRGPGL